MKRGSLIAIGLATYALGVIVFAPASLIDVGLQRAGQGRLHLVSAQGSLWSGSGQLELRDAQGRSGATKYLAWRLRPESLLRGQLAGDIELDRDGESFSLTLLPSGLAIANAEIRLPAAALGLALPRLAALGLDGELELSIPAMVIQHGQLRGRLALRLRNAGSAFTPVFPLGDYELSLDGQGSAVQVLLLTLQGPLQLDGNGAWTIGHKPEFLALAQIPPQHMQQLGPLLRLIAVERGGGRFELKF